MPRPNLIAGGLAAALRYLPHAWQSSAAALVLAAAGAILAVRFGGAWWLLAGVLALVARGGLWRLALRHGRPGFGGLQFGAIEARLAATWVLTATFLAILGLLLFVVFLCCAYAAASAGPGFNAAEVGSWAPAIVGRGRALLGVVGAAGITGLAYAALRISLAEPATIARGRPQILSAWALTRRRAFALLAANLAIAAPVLALVLWRPPGWLGAIALGGVFGGLWLPLSVGLMAYAYEAKGAA